MYLADTICRAFLNETKEQILPEIEFSSFTYLLISPEHCEDFQKATQEDLELQTLQAVVKSGWPDTKDNISKSTYLYLAFS